MKIIHFADLHLGVESYGRIDPTSGLSTRFQDFLVSFDQLVAYALDKKVDLVLFCGDAYKSRDPSQTQQREFARRLKKLSSCGIPVFLLVGNHDLPNAIGRATTTEIFDTLAIENVYVANRPGICRIATCEGIVQIIALPWLKRSSVLGKEDIKNLDFARLNQKMQEILTDVIARCIQELDPALPAILAAHVWVQGARVGSEGTMAIGQEHMLLPSAVANLALDYVALGHIHRHQVLATSPPVVYSGSLDSLDFGDEADAKGFYVVDINAGARKRCVQFEFQPIQGRRFITLDIGIKADDLSPTETVLNAMAQRAGEISGNIIRLEINLPQGLERQLRENEICDAAREAYYFALAKNIQREARPRLGDMLVEETTPLEALKAYLKSKSNVLPEKKAKRLLEYGQSIIRGEDL